MWGICTIEDLLLQTPKINFFLHVFYGINQSRRLKILRNKLKINQTCKNKILIYFITSLMNSHDRIAVGIELVGGLAKKILFIPGLLRGTILYLN